MFSSGAGYFCLPPSPYPLGIALNIAGCAQWLLPLTQHPGGRGWWISTSSRSVWCTQFQDRQNCIIQRSQHQPPTHLLQLFYVCECFLTPHVYHITICILSTCRGQKTDPWNWSYHKLSCGCWVLNLGPLQEQQVSLTAKLSSSLRSSSFTLLCDSGGEPLGIAFVVLLFVDFQLSLVKFEGLVWDVGCWIQRRKKISIYSFECSVDHLPLCFCLRDGSSLIFIGFSFLTQS